VANREIGVEVPTRRSGHRAQSEGRQLGIIGANKLFFVGLIDKSSDVDASDIADITQESPSTVGSPGEAHPWAK
jgi:hypothetical protein